jgi:kynurenine formamidase
MEALKYLYEVRRITATGHETTDTDPGLATTKEIIPSKATSSASIAIRSNYWRTSTRCRNPAL